MQSENPLSSYHNKRKNIFDDVYLRILTDQGYYTDSRDDINLLYEEIVYRVNESIGKGDFDKDTQELIKKDPSMLEKITSFYDPKLQKPTKVQVPKYKDTERNYTHFALENEAGEALSSISVKHENDGKRIYIDCACTKEGFDNKGLLTKLLIKTISFLKKKLPNLQDIYIGTRVKGKYVGNMGRYVHLFNKYGLENVTVRDRIVQTDIGRLLDSSKMPKDSEMNYLIKNKINQSWTLEENKKDLEGVLRQHSQFNKLNLGKSYELSQGSKNIQEILARPEQSIFVHGEMPKYEKLKTKKRGLYNGKSGQWM